MNLDTDPFSSRSRINKVKTDLATTLVICVSNDVESTVHNDRTGILSVY